MKITNECKTGHLNLNPLVRWEYNLFYHDNMKNKFNSCEDIRIFNCISFTSMNCYKDKNMNYISLRRFVCR